MQLSAVDLANDIWSCTSCPLIKEARQPVPFYGNINSPLLICGRNPGRQENMVGIPFVGPGGNCLTNVLYWVGIDRNNVLITNTAKCYSTNDRPPSDEEYDICIKKHLARELALFKPKIIVALGNDAFKKLTRVQDSVTRNRQRFFPLQSIGALIMGSWHPGSAVRGQRALQEMTEDFQWLVQTPEFKQSCLSCIR